MQSKENWTVVQHVSVTNEMREEDEEKVVHSATTEQREHPRENKDLHYKMERKKCIKTTRALINGVKKHQSL